MPLKEAMIASTDELVVNGRKYKGDQKGPCLIYHPL